MSELDVTLKDVEVNNDRIYALGDGGKRLDATSIIKNPREVIERKLAEERLKQLAEARAARMAMEDEFRDEALGERGRRFQQ